MNSNWFNEDGIIRTFVENDVNIIDLPDISSFSPKFKLGDEVTSLKTGLPTVGIVVGVLAGWLEFMNQCHARRSMLDIRDHTWSGIFGTEWVEKPVYYIMFKSGPQRPVSYQEYLNSPNLPEYMKNEDAYKKEIPERSIVSYAEDDLQLTEEI